MYSNKPNGSVLGLMMASPNIFELPFEKNYLAQPFIVLFLMELSLIS